MGELVHVCKPDTQEAELGEWRAEAGLVYTVREKKNKKGKNRKIQLLSHLRAYKAKCL